MPIRIAAFEGEARYPTFSREVGRPSTWRLAYEFQMLDVNIWRWDLSRRVAGLVAGSTGWDDFPALSPDGSRIAFASNRSGSNEIWTSGADGSEPRQLTFHQGPLVASPRWSPDNNRLAFTSQVGANRDVYVMKADGSGSTRLTTSPSEETNPSWSWDGRWIYYRSDQSGVGQIWKVAVTGGIPERVTAGEAVEAFESPDGRRLYFVRSTDTPGLWSVAVAGGPETLVLPNVRAGQWAVAQQGVFFLSPAEGKPAAGTTLNLYRFSTTTVEPVDDLPTPWRIVKTGFSVARDGRSMLWTQLDKMTRDLMVIDPWIPLAGTPP